MLKSFLWLTAISTMEINSDEVLKYFEEKTPWMNEKWPLHQAAIENAIETGLTETYGYKGMNVYIRRIPDHFLITKGYLHYDNEVHLLLLSVTLDELPNLRLPEVAFVLPNNVIQIESLMSTMILHATYTTFRNLSDVIYTVHDQDKSKSSPFRFQQVQDVGNLAIVVEGCILSGYILTIPNGESVTIGHETLRLTKCQFTFEISQGLGFPPIIAKYDPKGKGLSLEHLLIPPIRNEMLPKLQALLYSYINTSAIFGDKLQFLQNNFDRINDIARESNADFLKKYNELTIEKNQGICEIRDFSIIWNEGSKHSPNTNMIVLRKVLVTGLDTLYSANIGSPFRIPAVHTGEELRFNILQVRGEFYYKDEILNWTSEFLVILHDVEIDLSYVIDHAALRDKDEGSERGSHTKSIDLLEAIAWRAVEFVIPNSEYALSESLLIGYIQNELPELLTNHIAKMYADIYNVPKTKLYKKKKAKKIQDDYEQKENHPDDDSNGRD